MEFYGFLLKPFTENIGWLLKLGYLPFDLILGLSLMRFFSSQKQKILSLSLWLFNPINLYTTYLMGQFDVIPTMFVVLSLLLFIKGKELWGGLSLGMGVAFKIFPIFLLIPFVLQVNSWLKRLVLVILILGPYIIGNLIYFSSEGFRSSALMASQSLKSFYASIPVSGGQSILVFPTLLIVLYGLFYYHKIDVRYLWKRGLVILSLFFIFTHTHPQWLIWLTPFLIIDLVESNFKQSLIIVGVLLTWLGSLFFFDPSLTVGIFSPIISGPERTLSIWEQLGVSVDYNFSRSLLHSVFSGLVMLLIIIHVKPVKPN